MSQPAVVLIGADKGGVGKTTVARTLLNIKFEPAHSTPKSREARSSASIRT
jgi:2-phosphoglycerate kinase